MREKTTRDCKRNKSNNKPMKTMRFDLLFDIHFYLWSRFFSPLLLLGSFWQRTANRFRFSLWRLFASLWYICSTGLCLVKREYCSKWNFYALFPGHLLWNALNNIFIYFFYLSILITNCIAAIDMRFRGCFYWQKKIMSGSRRKRQKKPISKKWLFQMETK